MPSGLGVSLNGSPNRISDALKRRKTYKEHSEFLQSFQNYREVGRDGESERESGREEKGAMHG